MQEDCDGGGGIAEPLAGGGATVVEYELWAYVGIIGTLIPEIVAAAERAVRVLGPTAPYPFVVGAPEQSFILSHWNFRTAARVTAPKYPVALPTGRYLRVMSCCWSAETAGPREPRESVAVAALVRRGTRRINMKGSR